MGEGLGVPICDEEKSIDNLSNNPTHFIITEEIVAALGAEPDTLDMYCGIIAPVQRMPQVGHAVQFRATSQKMGKLSLIHFL